MDYANACDKIGHPICVSIFFLCWFWASVAVILIHAGQHTQYAVKSLGLRYLFGAHRRSFAYCTSAEYAQSRFGAHRAISNYDKRVDSIFFFFLSVMWSGDCGGISICYTFVYWLRLYFQSLPLQSLQLETKMTFQQFHNSPFLRRTIKTHFFLSFVSLQPHLDQINPHPFIIRFSSVVHSFSAAQEYHFFRLFKRRLKCYLKPH